MDRFQENAVKKFTEISGAERKSTDGWYHDQPDRAPQIWQNILQKLRPTSGETLLDIGCGSRELADLSISHAISEGIELTVLEIEASIQEIEKKYPKEVLSQFQRIAGVFPSLGEGSLLPGYDCILIYSMIHYSDDPCGLLKKAVSLLNPRGRLFLGDLPNINKKGRFLASDFGRAFESSRRGVSLTEIPRYSTHQEYASHPGDQNPRIRDSWIQGVFEEYRAQGLNVYVLPQPEGFPFSHTREDLLIERM